MAFDSVHLEAILKKICQRGRGILAADESASTIKKRFDSIHCESTVESRRSYRNMLFMTGGIEEYISGVILYDETVDQKTEDGQTFSEYLASKHIVPGIKTDMGKVDHPNFSPETITRGLDGLEERYEAYTKRSKGTLGFAKWRQVIDIGKGMPTRELVESALDAMAQYAAISQHAGYVPITEPEVLMDGDHSIDRCAEVTAMALTILYEMLEKHRVSIPHTLLKPNMVLSGKKSGVVDSPETVARATLEVFRSTVPSDVPGIVFLSGGQGPEQATGNLDAVARMVKKAKDPWWMSYSYGRALQDPALKAWGGKSENISRAQQAFDFRGRLNGRAQRGEYDVSMEHASSPSHVASAL